MSVSRNKPNTFEIFFCQNVRTFLKKKIGGCFDLHQKATRFWVYFLGLVDPSRNRLVSTAY